MHQKMMDFLCVARRWRGMLLEKVQLQKYRHSFVNTLPPFTFGGRGLHLQRNTKVKRPLSKVKEVVGGFSSIRNFKKCSQQLKCNTFWARNHSEKTIAYSAQEAATK